MSSIWIHLVGLWPSRFFAPAERLERLEVWPELREVITGCDDLGSTPQRWHGGTVAIQLPQKDGGDFTLQ